MENNKIESDPGDCVDLQLQRNHQQLSLLNAASASVNVTLTFDGTVTTGMYYILILHDRHHFPVTGILLIY